jgi:hypothetical protein
MTIYSVSSVRNLSAIALPYFSFPERSHCGRFFLLERYRVSLFSLPIPNLFHSRFDSKSLFSKRIVSRRRVPELSAPPPFKHNILW